MNSVPVTHVTNICQPFCSDEQTKLRGVAISFYIHVFFNQTMYVFVYHKWYLILFYINFLRAKCWLLVSISVLTNVHRDLGIPMVQSIKKISNSLPVYLLTEEVRFLLNVVAKAPQLLDNHSHVQR